MYPGIILETEYTNNSHMDGEAVQEKGQDSGWPSLLPPGSEVRKDEPRVGKPTVPSTYLRRLGGLLSQGTSLERGAGVGATLGHSFSGSALSPGKGKPITEGIWDRLQNRIHPAWAHCFCNEVQTPLRKAFKILRNLSPILTHFISL